MTRAIKIAVLALLIVSAGSMGSLGYYGAHMLAAWTDAAHAANATLTAVNRSCGPSQPCGTLADVNSTLATVRGTFGQVEIAARHENAQLTTLDGQERTLFDDLHGLAGDGRETLKGLTGLTQVASGTLGTTQETLKSSQTVLASLVRSSDALGDTSRSLTARFDDPNIVSLIASLSSTASHADKATADVQTVFDRVAHPPKCKGRWCWAITTGRIISAGRDVPEFGYWTDQLIQSLRSH